MMKLLAPLAALTFLLSSNARAEDDALTRDEVSALKKKLVAALDALGAAPATLVKEKDDFDLPTDAFRTDGKLQAVTCAVTRTHTIKAMQEAEKSQKAMVDEYQKKAMEAQAKGDYTALNKLTQEMQAKAMATAMAASQKQVVPVTIRVSLNEGMSEAIDPDGVVVEKPGVLALKSKNGGDEDPNGTVRIYFQPTALKDTKSLSKLNVFANDRSVPSKTSVATVTVSLDGNATDVEEWAKRVNFAKVLQLIDAPVK